MKRALVTLTVMAWVGGAAIAHAQNVVEIRLKSGRIVRGSQLDYTLDRVRIETSPGGAWLQFRPDEIKEIRSKRLTTPLRLSDPGRAPALERGTVEAYRAALPTAQSEAPPAEYDSTPQETAPAHAFRYSQVEHRRDAEGRLRLSFRVTHAGDAAYGRAWFEASVSDSMGNLVAARTILLTDFAAGQTREAEVDFGTLPRLVNARIRIVFLAGF